MTTQLDRNEIGLLKKHCIKYSDFYIKNWEKKEHFSVFDVEEKGGKLQNKLEIKCFSANFNVREKKIQSISGNEEAGRTPRPPPSLPDFSKNPGFPFVPRPWTNNPTAARGGKGEVRSELLLGEGEPRLLLALQPVGDVPQSEGLLNPVLPGEGRCQGDGVRGGAHGGAYGVRVDLPSDVDGNMVGAYGVRVDLPAVGGEGEGGVWCGWQSSACRTGSQQYSGVNCGAFADDLFHPFGVFGALKLALWEPCALRV